MVRGVRKLLVFFTLGFSCWGVLKYSDSSGSNANRLAELEVGQQLYRIEGEMASQKVQSSLLLEKIRKAVDENEKQRQEEQRIKAEEKPEEKPVTGGHPQGENPLPEGAGRIQGDPTDLEKDVGKKSSIVNPVPSPGPEPDASVIAVLVFVCDRPTVRRCLDTLFANRPSEEKFPIIVTQDCGDHPETSEVLASYGSALTRIMQPDLSDIKLQPKEMKMKGYYKISRHYGWALNYTFNTLNYKNVVIVEDDLEVAPDFFEYFGATLPILRSDPSLWCVSAWNDNGKSKRINETAHELLHRTDFFPGLGWMLTKDLWTELMVKWPKGYWDDWMREPSQRRGRACIRPEISRTITFGKKGVSQGTYFQNHLRYIVLNNKFVPFNQMDLSYLTKDKYDVEFVKKVYSSQVVESVQKLAEAIASTTVEDAEYRLTYRGRSSFASLAKQLNLMDDLRAGVPRTAYRGVVPFMYQGHRVYLAPGASWTGYT